MKVIEKNKKRFVRHRRVRAGVIGTSERPRLSVFRSNKHIVLQLIDDARGRTLLQVNDLSDKKKTTKTERAYELGEKLAELAMAKKIKTVVFDRGGYLYHGCIKSVAEGCRKGGLLF